MYPSALFLSSAHLSSRSGTYKRKYTSLYYLDIYSGRLKHKSLESRWLNRSFVMKLTLQQQQNLDILHYVHVGRCYRPTRLTCLGKRLFYTLIHIVSQWQLSNIWRYRYIFSTIVYDSYHTFSVFFQAWK